MNYLENFYGSLFTPVKTFDELIENKNIVQAIINVIIVSVIFNLLNIGSNLIDVKSIIFFSFQIIFSAVGALISWFLFGVFFEAISYIFEKSGKLKEILTLSGFSVTPWFLIAPFKMLSTAGLALGVLSVYFQFALWIWVSVLLFISVMKVYKLTFSRTVLIFLVPLLGFIMFSNWFAYFFSTMSKILN